MPLRVLDVRIRAVEIHKISLCDVVCDHHICVLRLTIIVSMLEAIRRVILRSGVMPVRFDNGPSVGSRYKFKATLLGELY